MIKHPRRAGTTGCRTCRRAGRATCLTSAQVAETSGGAAHQEILQLLDECSPMGIERLDDKYGARIYWTALALTPEDATAEELTMQAYLAVWRGARPCAQCENIAVCSCFLTCAGHSDSPPPVWEESSWPRVDDIECAPSALPHLCGTRRDWLPHARIDPRLPWRRIQQP